MTRPVLFVVDRDEHSRKALMGDLTGRFGNDFTVAGESSPIAATRRTRSHGSRQSPGGAGPRRQRR